MMREIVLYENVGSCTNFHKSWRWKLLTRSENWRREQSWLLKKIYWLWKSEFCKLLGIGKFFYPNKTKIKVFNYQVTIPAKGKKNFKACTEMKSVGFIVRRWKNTQFIISFLAPATITILMNVSFKIECVGTAYNSCYFFYFKIFYS